METGKTKIKLILHAMGWEIDYLLNYFTQLKKSKYYLPKNVDITINITLNLSDYFINWELSKLPKEFFINKFEHIKPLLIDYKLESKIIHTGVYGHLNAQRDAIDNETEYYILSTPDIIFDEKLLAYPGKRAPLSQVWYIYDLEKENIEEGKTPFFYLMVGTDRVSEFSSFIKSAFSLSDILVSRFFMIFQLNCFCILKKLEAAPSTPSDFKILPVSTSINLASILRLPIISKYPPVRIT